MSVEEALGNAGATEPPPSVADLGGEAAVVDAVTGLPEEHLPLLAEAVMADFVSLADPVAVAGAISERLPEVSGSVSFANLADILLFMAAEASNEELTKTLREALLATLRAEEQTDGLRAGAALRTAVDLTLLDVGTTTAPVVAYLEDLDTVPIASAPTFVRALGALADHVDVTQDEMLMTLAREAADKDEDVAADVQMELGWHAFREAFSADELSEQQACLDRARRAFKSASANDENRPDARAFAAGAALTAAFLGGADPDSAYNELADAKREWTLYATTTGCIADDRAYINIAAWHRLAGELRELHDALEEELLIRVAQAAQTLAVAYEGSRLRVFENQSLRVDSIIAPAIERRVKSSKLLPQALAELADDESAPGTGALGRVVRPKAPTPAAKHPEWRLRLV